MKTTLTAVLVSLLCASAVAQETKPADLALKRLQERQAERAATATRPTSLSAAEVDALRATILRLEAENQALKKQIAALSGKPTAATSSKPPESTFASRTRSGNAGRKDAKAKAALANAEKVDEAIRKYLAAHPVSEEVQKALWAGTPAVGMELEALKIIGNVETLTQAQNETGIAFYPHDYVIYATAGEARWYAVRISDGKVDYISVR